MKMVINEPVYCSCKKCICELTGTECVCAKAKAANSRVQLQAQVLSLAEKLNDCRL
jgi:hypothetical protein